MHLHMNIQFVVELMFPSVCPLLAAFVSIHFLFLEFVALLVSVMLVAQPEQGRNRPVAVNAQNALAAG